MSTDDDAKPPAQMGYMVTGNLPASVKDLVEPGVKEAAKKFHVSTPKGSSFAFDSAVA